MKVRMASMPIMRPTDLIVRVGDAGATIARGAGVAGVVVEMGSQVLGFALGEQVAGPADSEGRGPHVRIDYRSAQRVAGPA